MKFNKTLVIIVVCFAAFVLSIYSFNFGIGLSNKLETWAWLGDYLAGTVGVFITFISFLALLKTISLQSQELSETRKEITRTRIAHESSTQYSRLNALLALRANYMEIMSIQFKNAKAWQTDESGKYVPKLDGFIEACENRIIEAETKLNEVNKEIEHYHEKIMKEGM
ncbi:MAG: hypothetical protein HWE10_01545 [Gammaproteobacteria bacterium]|nr:hypothetical protein [Gammaproteobacteria bacterium]